MPTFASKMDRKFELKELCGLKLKELGSTQKIFGSLIATEYGPIAARAI